MIINLTESNADKLSQIAKDYQSSFSTGQLIEINFAENLEFNFLKDGYGVFAGAKVENATDRPWDISIRIYRTSDRLGLVHIDFDRYLQIINRVDNLDVPKERADAAFSLVMPLIGYLIKYSTRNRRLSLPDSNRIRSLSISKKQHKPTHYIGDIIERSTSSEPTGRTNSPHERCAHFRRLKSGKTIRVRSCIIHPDRFEGSVQKTLTGV